MSARTMAWGWHIIFSGVLENKNAAKLVLLRICDRADSDGICWPGHGKTANELRLSKTIVKESIKLFESLNLLTIRHRMSDEGDATSNLYILNLDIQFCAQEAEERSGVGQPVPHPESARGGSASAPPLGQPVPQGGALADPEPKREPVIQKKQQHARARVHAPANAGAAAAEPVKKGKENKAFRIISGVECWSPEDSASAMALADLHGQEAVLDAVKALKDQGIAPVPGRVATALARAAAAARATAASATAAARIAQLERASRARADRDMQELMAMEAHQTSQERDP